MKKDEIPSAEELTTILENDVSYDILISRTKFASFVAIEFAKLHVKAALEAASIDAFGEDGSSVDEDSILSSYPEELIK